MFEKYMTKYFNTFLVQSFNEGFIMTNPDLRLSIRGYIHDCLSNQSMRLNTRLVEKYKDKRYQVRVEVISPHDGGDTFDCGDERLVQIDIPNKTFAQSKLWEVYHKLKLDGYEHNKFYGNNYLIVHSLVYRHIITYKAYFHRDRLARTHCNLRFYLDTLFRKFRVSQKKGLDYVYIYFNPVDDDME